MKKIQLWVPHVSKAPVSTLHADWDKNNPPLAEASFAKAEALVKQLAAEAGPPARIFISDRLRAWQTALPSLRAYPDVPVYCQCFFGQYDSADAIEGDPRADEFGMVNYAIPSTDRQWFDWFWEAQRYMRDTPQNGEGPDWVFSHRPLVAMARFATENGLRVPKPKELYPIAMDNSLLFPFVPLEVNDQLVVTLARASA